MSSKCHYRQNLKLSNILGLVSTWMGDRSLVRAVRAVCPHGPFKPLACMGRLGLSVFFGQIWPFEPLARMGRLGHLTRFGSSGSLGHSGSLGLLGHLRR